jgi:magnesium transporter
MVDADPVRTSAGDATSDTAPAGRGLPRAFGKPVRAMTRMLGQLPGPGGGPPSAAEPDEQAIVEVGLFVGGKHRPEKLAYPEAVETARQHPDGFVWLGLEQPSAAQFARIAETFGLHELAVEDAVKSGQRPKIERYGDVAFGALRTARYVEHEELTESSEVVDTGNVMMFIGPHFIITVRHGDQCDLSKVYAILEDRHDLLRHGPWAVAYAVYDLVVDGYLDVADAIEDDIEVIEEHVFAPRGKGYRGRIQRIYQLKRELMEFKRAVLPLQRPVSGLVGGHLVDLPKEIRRYFRDVNDHLNRAVEQVVYFDDLLNSILQARLAQVTVDQNNDMRKIAAWAGIAAVWTAIAGVYGMNFEYMPELDWRYGYPGVVTIMLVISALLYRAFRRSGWL